MNGRSFSSFIPLTSYGFSSRSLLPYCFSKIIFYRLHISRQPAFLGFAFLGNPDYSPLALNR
jgi:hypothetical protein